MALGPVFPYSLIVEENGMGWPGIHEGGGGGREQGLQIPNATDIVADINIHMRFQMPSASFLSHQLRIISIANAATGIVIVDPAWIPSGGIDAVEPGALTLQPEAVDENITWVTGDEDKWIESVIPLEADSAAVPDDILLVDLVVKNTGTTLAVVSTHVFMIIFPS